MERTTRKVRISVAALLCTAIARLACGQTMSTEATRTGGVTTTASTTGGTTTTTTATDSIALLSQADLTTTNASTQVGVQAIDLYFNRNFRLYFRTTLPISQAKPTTEETTTKPAMSDSAIAALQDPFGGSLSLTGGYWGQLYRAHVPKLTNGLCQAGTPDDKGKCHDDGHGLYLDLRGGVKLINLPDQGETSPSVAGTKVSPFYTGVAQLRFAHHLYVDSAQQKTVGDIELSVGGVWNYLVDKTLSSVYSNGLLAVNTGAIQASLALTLTGNLGLTMSTSLWSHNSGTQTLGREFNVGIKLLSKAAQ